MIGEIPTPGGYSMDNTGTHVRKERSGMASVRAVIARINHIINFIGVWLFRLRKIVMAAPVVYYALKLARYNMEHLPEIVGVNLQSNGAFADTISRSLAVMGPLGVTAACLVLMLFSRKALMPWAVCVFTLILPILILVSNMYPA